MKFKTPQEAIDYYHRHQGSVVGMIGRLCAKARWCRPVLKRIKLSHGQEALQHGDVDPVLLSIRDAPDTRRVTTHEICMDIRAAMDAAIDAVEAENPKHRTVAILLFGGYQGFVIQKAGGYKRAQYFEIKKQALTYFKRNLEERRLM